jgi:hypothetical protein
MKYIVICAGESGWQYPTPDDGESRHFCDAPILIADGKGKAQGVSIERGLRVQDVLGRMIMIQEVGVVQSKEGDINIENRMQKRGPALGVIGCQCVMRQ